MKDRTKQAMVHIREPLPPRGGNNFYRDKRDFSHLAKSLCGGPITDKDVTIRDAMGCINGKWPLCSKCEQLFKIARGL